MRRLPPGHDGHAQGVLLPDDALVLLQERLDLVLDGRGRGRRFRRGGAFGCTRRHGKVGVEGLAETLLDVQGVGLVRAQLSLQGLLLGLVLDVPRVEGCKLLQGLYHGRCGGIIAGWCGREEGPQTLQVRARVLVGVGISRCVQASSLGRLIGRGRCLFVVHQESLLRRRWTR